MFDLSGIGTIIGDPELRAMLKSLTTRKINSDIKTIQAHAELSRYLMKNKREKGETSEEVREVLREHLEYYGALVDLSLQFHQRLIDQLKEAEGSGGGAVSGGKLTLNISAQSGAIVRAPFKVANSRNQPISISCSASPFVSESGDHMVASAITFEPAAREIAGGSDGVFEAVLPVNDDFEPGRTYFATLKAEGVEAMSILMRLKVEPKPAEAQETPDTDAPPAAKKPAAAEKPTKPATAKAAARKPAATASKTPAKAASKTATKAPRSTAAKGTAKAPAARRKRAPAKKTK